MKRILILHSSFSSAHKYENLNFSKAQNQKSFGRCYSEHGHGHNYKIEVGFAVPTKTTEAELEKNHFILQQQLTKLTWKLDHQHLNFDINEFKSIIPTSENILLYFENKLRNLKLKNSLVFIKLFEMENLWSEKYYVTK